MNKKEILFWLKRYNDYQKKEYAMTERELSKIIRKQGFLTKKQLEKLVEWKFGDYPARKKREVQLVKQMNESFIKQTTKLALESQDDLTRIRILYELKGVKNAVASTILAFYDPKKNGIFDIHSWRELFGKEDKKFWSKPKLLIKYLITIRKIAQRNQLTAREIDKALYQQNYETSSKKLKK